MKISLKIGRLIVQKRLGDGLQQFYSKMLSLPKNLEQIRKVLKYSVLNEKYRIGNVIGNGSYGLIFYGQNIMEGNKPIAIKVIDLGHSDQSWDSQRKAKYLRHCAEEDEAMRACSGEHIMKCYDTIYSEKLNVKMIVLEFCKFDCLETLIFQKTYLPQVEAKAILKQVLFGLAQFHRNGRIHRDIKTGNICLTEDRVVVGDFGCSRIFLFENELGRWRETIEKGGLTKIGTICSRSPEMLLNNAQYGLKSDLWSIGVMYYEMLLGFPPFFFEQSLTDEEIYVEITKHIDHVIQPFYIEERSKKELLNGIKTPKLSFKAKHFLKRLLQLSPEKRMGWRELFMCEYLMEDQIHEYFYPPQCILPLQNKNWESLDKYLHCLEEIETKNISSPPPKELPQELQLMRSISKQIKENFLHNYKQFEKTIQSMFYEIKMIHFELRRVELLMKVRDQILKVHGNHRFNAVRLGLISICFYKYTQIEEKFIQKKSFLANFRNEKFLAKLNHDYQEEMELVQNKTEGFFGFLNFFNPKKKVWQNIANQSNFKELCQKVLSLLSSLKKSQIKSEINEQNTIYFIDYDEDILSFQPYNRENKFKWLVWKNLKQIRQLNK